MSFLCLSKCNRIRHPFPMFSLILQCVTILQSNVSTCNRLMHPFPCPPKSDHSQEHPCAVYFSTESDVSMPKLPPASNSTLIWFCGIWSHPYLILSHLILPYPPSYACPSYNWTRYPLSLSVHSLIISDHYLTIIWPYLTIFHVCPLSDHSTWMNESTPFECLTNDYWAFQ